MDTKGWDLSIVVPLHNEEENVGRLHPRIVAACDPLGVRYEAIYVDDGSTDGTWAELRKLNGGAGEIVCAQLARNSGQTPAMAAGFRLARGRIVVSMDGDLQNDPADIPRLLEKCDEGYDLVCGWRKNRQDKLISRKIPSKCANWLIRKVTGVQVHDYGCSLKAYRRPLVQRMRLYSDMHRFLPFISQMSGARVTELPVNHAPRIYGTTKYGIGRTWKVLFDLITLKMLVHYSSRSLFWFFGLAIVPLMLSAGFMITTVVGGIENAVVLFGCGIAFGTLGVFMLFLGLLSGILLGSDRREFEHLIVREHGHPAEAPA